MVFCHNSVEEIAHFVFNFRCYSLETPLRGDPSQF